MKLFPLPLPSDQVICIEEREPSKQPPSLIPYVAPGEFPYQIPDSLTEGVDYHIINSHDRDYRDYATTLLSPFLGRGTYADDTHKIYRGEAENSSGKKYSPSWKATPLALRRRYVVFFNKYKTTRIMMLDLDSKNAQFAWYYAGLKQPFVINTNPISGKCQYWYLLDGYYEKEPYYTIRDSMLRALAPHVNVNRKIGDKGIDFSKPEVCRSPLFYPFTNRARTKKRNNAGFVKDGKKQADYTNIILSEKVMVYSLEDLDARSLTLDQMEFSTEGPIHTQQQYNTIQKVKYIKRLTDPDKPSRHMDMVACVGGNAKKLYRPWLPEVEIKKSMYAVYKNAADPTLPDCQIMASVNCTYRNAKATWDATKHCKSVNNSNRSPDKQSYRINTYWNTERMFRPLLIDYANENRIPYVTVKSWYKSGKLKLVNGKLVKAADQTLKDAVTTLGRSYATLKRQKANGSIELVDRVWVDVAPSTASGIIIKETPTGFTDGHVAPEATFAPEVDECQSVTFSEFARLLELAENVKEEPRLPPPILKEKSAMEWIRIWDG